MGPGAGDAHGGLIQAQHAGLHGPGGQELGGGDHVFGDRLAAVGPEQTGGEGGPGAVDALLIEGQVDVIRRLDECDFFHGDSLSILGQLGQGVGVDEGRRLLAGFGGVVLGFLEDGCAVVDDGDDVRVATPDGDGAGVRLGGDRGLQEDGRVDAG